MDGRSRYVYIFFLLFFHITSRKLYDTLLDFLVFISHVNHANSNIHWATLVKISPNIIADKGIFNKVSVLSYFIPLK